MNRDAFEIEKWMEENTMCVEVNSAWVVWQAACCYQRESDAKICDDKAGAMWIWWDSRADPTDQGQALAADDLSELIRANKGE